MRQIATVSRQRVFSVAALLLLLIPSISTLPPTTARADEITIKLAKFQFAPNQVSIPLGTTITWSNTDFTTHNVAIAQGPELFVSPVLDQDSTVKYTFTKPGKYHYFCEWHPEMQGNITVTLPDGTSNSSPAVIPRLFAETGKSVRGSLLTYWQSHGGLAQQGFPISEEMSEKSDTDGKFYTVQYFERAVFEMHPENQPPYDVLLSLLGNFQYKQKYPNGAPGQQPNTSAGSILFKETGKHLGGKFLDYWNTHGGLAQQGFPISEEFQEKSALDGKTYRVQYFERAVFELHTENKAPFDVLLSQLGKFRYDARSIGGKPNGSIYQVGVSQSPQHYPLLAGPHAAAGVNAWIYDQDPKPVLSWINELGVKWVLHQLSWYQIEPDKGAYRWDKIDPAVNALYAAGIKIILNPVQAPQWAWASDKVGYPQDPADFGRFMSLVAQRYKGKVAGYQIWNEPNFAHETGPNASTSHYGAILKQGYTAIKAVDPQAIVVLGALTPTGVNDPFVAVDDVEFLRRLYSYNSGELKGYFDVLGAHPGSNANPPEDMWPDKPGPGPGWTTHGSFYFRRVEQLRQVMVENGDAQKQIWLTEFGWASTIKAAPNFEYAEQVTEQEQADYIATAMRMGRDQYPWMGPMLVFGLNFSLPNVSTDPADERIAWSLLRRDGSKRPSFFAVKDFASGK